MEVGSYSRDYSPVVFDHDNNLTNVMIDESQRYIGLELELEFDYDIYGGYDEDNPDYQEELEVYLSEYDEHIYIENPYYSEPENGIVDEMVDDYYERGYSAIKLKHDGSLSNGIEVVSHPVPVHLFETMLQNTRPFEFMRDLWKERDEYETDNNAGVHMHITNLGGKKEQGLVEYIVYRIQSDLQDYTRDSAYASPFPLSELEVLTRIVNGEGLASGNHYIVRNNYKGDCHTHEFRVFNVPEGYTDDHFNERIMQYANMVKKVVDYASQFKLAQLVSSKIEIDEDLNIEIIPNARLNWLEILSGLSSDKLLEMMVI